MKDKKYALVQITKAYWLGILIDKLFSCTDTDRAGMIRKDQITMGFCCP